MKGKRKREGKEIKTVFIVVILILIIFGASYAGVEIFRNKKIDGEQNKEAQIEEEPQKLYEAEYSMHTGDAFVKIGDYIGYINKLDNSTQIINIKEGIAIKANTPERGLEKLYFDGENMYGVPNHYSGKGIYKIDLQGNVTKIYEGECVQLWLTDDRIYFVKQDGFDEINQTPQGDLCYMDKEGKNITTVIRNVKNYFKIHNDNIYYTDWTTIDLYKADINGENKILLAEGRTYITGVNDKYITYTDFEDGEKSHVVYLDDNTNHEIGRFGNSYISEEYGYVCTRKLIGDNNEIENEFSLFKIDEESKEEKQIFTDEDMTRISYVHNDIAYFGNQGIEKVSIKEENQSKESTGIGSAYFLDGYAYEFKRNNDKVSEVVITNLENNEKQNIGITYKENLQNDDNNSNASSDNTTTKNNISSSSNKTITEQTNTQKTNDEVYGWKNESIEGKRAISKEEAIQIWKNNILNLGKNNNIINYKDYTVMLNISQVEVKPNSQFTQTDILPERQASFTRQAWKIETAENTDALQMLDVYIDMYTGEIIGGRIYGD